MIRPRTDPAHTLPTGGPAVPSVGVVGLVPDPLAAAWQPRHQVMLRLARHFHVAWLEPPRHWRELLGGGRGGEGRELGAVASPPGLLHHDPALPFFHRPGFAAELAARARVRGAVRRLRRAGCRKVVLYLWQPRFLPDLDRVAHDASCYHIDDEYSFSEEERPTSEEELAVLRRVDQVFIHSPALLEKKGEVNPHTDFVPNGVDYAAFATPRPEPEDLARIPRPRIGYIGYLKKQLDWDLLEGLARRHPAWSFVMVGPRHAHPEIDGALERMAARDNVHLLGPRSVGDISAYPQHFDVSILPYRVNDYTRYINPLKLYEYLAAGPPVVGAPIRTLLDFSEVVSTADGLEAWSAAIEEALRDPERSEARRAERRAVARGYDWDLLVAGVARKIAERLGPDVARAFSAPAGLG